jgi:hypothetical protein
MKAQTWMKEQCLLFLLMCHRYSMFPFLCYCNCNMSVISHDFIVSRAIAGRGNQIAVIVVMKKFLLWSNFIYSILFKGKFQCSVNTLRVGRAIWRLLLLNVADRSRHMTLLGHVMLQHTIPCSGVTQAHNCCVIELLNICLVVSKHDLAVFLSHSKWKCLCSSSSCMYQAVI